MKLSAQKLTLAVLLLIACVRPALAQNYPYPGKSSAAPVKCTGCLGVNSSGQANANLPTWPYAPPLLNHVGRVVDSTEVTDFQGNTGFATARARIVKIVRERHGTLPPRVYMQVGSAIAIYSLDKFFTTQLPGPLTSIGTVVGRVIRGNYPNEKVLKWDAWIFPESPASGWQLTLVDGQDKLYDFDVDDRGFVYVATGSHFGWGIVRDSGQSDATQLSLVPDTQFMNNAVSPDRIMSVKTGGRYYVVTASIGDAGGRMVYDVNNVGAIAQKLTKLGTAAGFQAYAKDEIRDRVAIVTMMRRLEIYDAETFVNGGGAMAAFEAPSGKYYRDVTVDENGNFWTSETSSTPSDNKVVKLERGASGYTRRTFDVYGEPFTPAPGQSEGLSTINYGDKYLTVMGRAGAGTVLETDVKIFKIEGGVPTPVNVGGFFNKFYHKAPRDYAQPRQTTRSMGAYPIKWNNKQYLIYNVQSLGDVYELQAGDSINVTQKSGTFGRPNPYAKSTTAGPFYGDVLRFSAASSSATQYALTWKFDNIDAGTLNEKPGNTGQDVDYQFTGLDRATAIEATRVVTATANSDTEVSGSVSVTQKVPTARIGVANTDIVVTADNSALVIVAGDQLTDASDGNVEGHYSAWTLDSTSPKQAPDEPLAAPGVGTHTLALAAKYGKYNASFVTAGTAAYTDTVSNIALTVRPFVISFADATTPGNGVTFHASARVTQQSSVLSASTWNVEWTLKNGTTDVIPVKSVSAPVGTIPEYPAPDRSAIPSGSVLQLTVTVPSGLGAGVPAEYGTQVITQTLVTPDPKITKTVCANTTDPCTFTVSSANARPTTDWTVVWTLKNAAGTSVATQTGKASDQFKPAFPGPGSYTVTVKATTKLFEGTASTGSFDVAGPACGEMPTADDIAIYTSCDTCAVGTTVTLRPESFNFTYKFPDCDEYVWNFGDGSPAVTVKTLSTTHKYTSTGTFTIRLRIKKGTETSIEFTQSIRIGNDTPPPPPPPPCTAPSNIQVLYNGSKGCQPGVPCKTTESVKFTAYRGSGSLATCDTASWDFGDGGTSSSVSPNHTFTSAGTHTINVTITNTSGSALGSVSLPVVVDEGGGSCSAPANADQVYIDYTGPTSGCTALNTSKVCRANEQIRFKVLPYLGATIQACDKFDWDFGDGSAHSTAAEPTHAYAGGVASYRVRLRIYNTSNSTGNVIVVDVPFQAAPVLPVPKLSYVNFPKTGTKGNTVTFTASSDISATGWLWNFGDGQTDNTQAGAVGTTNTVTHTYAAKGTYTVTVRARNSQDTSNAELSQVDNSITIDETPEYRFLLPAVAHAAGIGSTWRTDVQIYTSDPAVTPANPLAFTASYKGVDYPLNMTKSTVIIQDILNELRPGQTEQGSMIIRVKTQHPPQIWSRTYNQTAEGTFGQFIPAILLNNAGGGSAVGEGKYYLAGLRSNSRYRTNIGLVNPNEQSITAVVRVYDDTGLQIAAPMSRPLTPFQLDQFPVTGPADRPFSVEIEVPAGTWVIGYASLIDGGSSDPAYIQAIRQSELGSSDYRETALPGVGHVGSWRSDVTIYNPNGRRITVDLAYHNAAGQRLASAPNVPIDAGQFLQYSDILRQGIFANVADGVGTMRVSVPASLSADYFPMVFARTYNDNGSGKTYGQGIPGFAVNRANVKVGKAALIPAVRSDDKYYTNVGLTNVSSSVAVATVRVLDPNTGQEVRRIDYTLQPNESIVATQFDIVGRANASLKIEASGANIWAFASIIDRGTFDPEYVPATPLP